MADPIILYDIPSIDSRSCWSLNTWKVRAALNLKRIPYKTHWLEYPEIAPHLSSLGIPPNTGDTAYTIPTVTLPDGSHIMQTKAILPVLESIQPEPSLHLDDDPARVLKILGPLWGAVAKVTLPQTARALNPPSREYFERTRFKIWDRALPELAVDEEVRAQAWEDVRPVAKEMAELLRETEGPFLAGEKLSYLDLYLLGVWSHWKKVSPEDLFKRVVEAEPELLKHYEACKWLTERND